MRESVKNTKNKVIKNKSVCMTKGGNQLEKAKDQYTAEEQALIANYDKLKNKKPLKFVATKRDKTFNLKDDYLLAIAKMTEAFGTYDEDLQDFFRSQVIKTFEGCQSSEGFCENSKMVEILNSAMAILQGIKPQDEIEGMLAVQMIGVHNMAMAAMRRAMISDQYPAAREQNTNSTTKLLRMFVAQIEALKKYRTGGEQKMIVEHVHVHEGGQAIVGSVKQGGGHEEEK